MPHAAPIRYTALSLDIYIQPNSCRLVGGCGFKPEGVCEAVLRIRAAIRARAYSRGDCLDGIITREGFGT